MKPNSTSLLHQIIKASRESVECVPWSIIYENNRIFTRVYKANFTLNSFIIWRGRCNLNVWKKNLQSCVWVKEIKRHSENLLPPHNWAHTPSIKCASVALWLFTQKCHLEFQLPQWGPTRWVPMARGVKERTLEATVSTIYKNSSSYQRIKFGNSFVKVPGRARV